MLFEQFVNEIELFADPPEVQTLALFEDEYIIIESQVTTVELFVGLLLMLWQSIWAKN